MRETKKTVSPSMKSSIGGGGCVNEWKRGARLDGKGRKAVWREGSVEEIRDRPRR